MKAVKDKFTEWFDAGIKPTYAGVYEMNDVCRLHPLYRYWNGQDWYYGGNSVAFAVSWRNNRVERVGVLSALPWRGLKEKPKDV